MSLNDSNLLLLLAVLSLTIAITSTVSGMLREHYQAKLEEKRLKLEMLKLAGDMKDEQINLMRQIHTIH